MLHQYRETFVALILGIDPLSPPIDSGKFNDEGKSIVSPRPSALRTTSTTLPLHPKSSTLSTSASSSTTTSPRPNTISLSSTSKAMEIEGDGDDDDNEREVVDIDDIERDGEEPMDEEDGNGRLKDMESNKKRSKKVVTLRERAHSLISDDDNDNGDHLHDACQNRHWSYNPYPLQHYKYSFKDRTIFLSLIRSWRYIWKSCTNNVSLVECDIIDSQYYDSLLLILTYEYTRFMDHVTSFLTSSQCQDVYRGEPYAIVSDFLSMFWLNSLHPRLVPGLLREEMIVHLNNLDNKRCMVLYKMCFVVLI